MGLGVLQNALQFSKNDMEILTNSHDLLAKQKNTSILLKIMLKGKKSEKAYEK